MVTEKKSAKKYNKWIIILSIIIPLIVALLFIVKIPNVEPLTFLPPIYAGMNSITALALIAAVITIKKKDKKAHEYLMKSAMIFSVLFLILYIIYHMTSDATPYGGEGTIKYIYYFILITHIILSIVVIPFVLITYVSAITNDFERHKKIARFTFPLWLYVAVSGVTVYLMIAPYY